MLTESFEGNFLNEILKVELPSHTVDSYTSLRFFGNRKKTLQLNPIQAISNHLVAIKCSCFAKITPKFCSVLHLKLNIRRRTFKLSDYREYFKSK